MIPGKLQELTPEQQRLMKVIANKWINLALGGKDLTRQEVETDIEWIYSKIGLPKPLILIADSYLAQKLMINMLALGKVIDAQDRQVQRQVRSQVESEVWRQVESQVWRQLLSQVESEVWRQVESQVWRQVQSEVWREVQNEVRIQVESQVWREVQSQVWRQVQSEVLSQVWSEVRSEVESQVDRQVRIEVQNQVWGEVQNKVWGEVQSQAWSEVQSEVWGEVRKHDLQFVEHWYGLGHETWLSFIDFFREIGIVNSTDFDRWAGMMAKGIWNIAFFDKAVFICKLPLKVCKDQEGRLHSTTEAAVQWRDGLDNYFIRGVAFDRELWRKITCGQITCKEILQLKNIEQRYVALSVYGPEKMLSELDAELINRSKRGNELYALSDIIAGRKLKLLKYRDPSTDRVYVSFVPDKYRRADSAMAWKFYLTEDEYKRLKVEA